jgi:sugar lactone lactonase YvrE
MLRRFRLAAEVISVFCVLFPLGAGAQQTPIALPNTVSTVGGGATSPLTVGAVCSAVSSLTATDTLGDGCLATSAYFNTTALGDLRGGVATDPAGNVYVMDSEDAAVRMINARSGIITLVAGLGTACSSKTDSNGDNCPLADTKFSSTPRGVASDPYGNILVAGYNSHLVNLICNAVSPLCPNTAGTHQVGFMYLIAGCVATTGSAGTSGPGAATGANGGTATPTGTCSTGVTELDGARGVAADSYGNVYIADTGDLRYRVVVGPASYNGVANPLATLIAFNPTYNAVTAATAAGNIYPLLGGFTSPASGSPCVTGSSTNSLDAFGDGCPYYVSSLNSPSSSAVQGIAVDSNGNILISDVSTGRLRVIYMGGALMANVITVNNPTVASPVVGSIYSIAGGGSSGSTTTPQLGKNVSIDTSAFKITTDSLGNIYIGDNTFVLFFDISTGYIRKLVPSGSTFGSSNGLGVALNGLGDLFLGDTTNLLIRKVAASSLVSTPVNSSSTQSILLHGGPGTTSIAASLANIATTDPISVGTPSCGSVHADNTLDCTVPVTFAPLSPGTHTATLAAVPSGTSTTALLPLTGTATGTALVYDGSGTTATMLGSSLEPTGLVTDGNGNLFTYDIATSTVTEVTAAGTVIHLSGALPGIPTQIALDASGNVYAAGGGSASITKFALGSTGTYTAGSISFTPNGAAATPQAIAIDAYGNIFVYDSTSKAIYRQNKSTAGTLISTIASGFDNVVSLALDSRGNLDVSDTGTKTIYSINAAGTQTTVATNVSAVGLSVDSAGDLYAADALTESIFEYPVSGPRTTLGVTLTTAAGVAADPSGNVYAADTTQPGLLSIPRSLTSVGFGTSTSTTRTGTVTNAGNIAASGVAQTDSTDITLTAGSSAGCTLSTTSTTFASGESCTVQATFTPNGLNTGTPVSDTVSLLPAATTIGSVTYTAVAPVNPTTTGITGETPSTPLFAAVGTEVTFTIAVTNAPSGSSVLVTIDSGAATSYPLNSAGVATVSLSGLAAGSHSISASFAGTTNAGPSSAATTFTINQFVATGDSRTVTEPSFPAVCTALTAALTSVNDDIPASVDATVTNPDGARIQAALNSCATSNPGQAVELSVDGAGHNAFLTGPLSIPSNVTLLVDPGVFVYFSRNVQDYDVVPGTHTCGTVNSNSATSSCQPLIDIKHATNVGIMGFGKLDGRGGDTLINAFPSTFAGQSWWGLSSIANSGGSQQNPRFIQIDSGSSNITLYKITIRNSPLFHVSTTGAASNFTAWDIKIVTPTSSRNTDGIDPGNAQNFTITRSWISDGDDNIAVGAANTTPATNISVTNNHFFAGHGESIGSFTQAGVSNVLFDGNMSSGNGIAGAGSSVANTADSNSTGIRIKSGYDRGGVVSSVQYSNSCFQDHKAEVVFSPNFENTTGSASPNFENILLQNLTFLTEGTVQFTGTNNNGSVFPLQVTLDNVNFVKLQTSDFGTTAAGTAPTNASLTYGPGQVSTNFINSYATFLGSGGNNTVTNQITESSLLPPVCNFTYIAPELTGPAGLPQTITEGQNATAVVILTPAVGGSAYPTGTVTVTDALTSNSTTVALTGTGDTISIPLTDLAVGTHTFTATYSGDANYIPSAPGSPYTTTESYLITVNPGSLGGSTTMLSGVPAGTPFGTSFTAVATVAGSNPTGTVQFIVNGSAYATAALSSVTASANITLPFSTTTYSIFAVYSGDAANAGSTSSPSLLNITPAGTATMLSASTTTTTLGHPVVLTAIVSSSAGIPAGTVSFSYTTSSNSTPVSIGPAVALTNSSASTSAELPQGTNSITATYAGNGGFAGSASAPMTVTINLPTIIGLPSNPVALPFTITTIAGGATASNANTTCAGSTDSFGDGCQATATTISASNDLRAVAADPFGNIYFSDKVAKLVRRIAPNGVISNFAGKVSGTTCVPTATVGCTPTLVAINAARGVSSDGQGNIYIADFGGNKVYKVSVSTGLMFLVAGTGTAGATTNGSPATSTDVDAPRGVWADTVGNIYIADTSANEILVVDPTGAIHIFAGTGSAASNGDGGAATSAAINNPQGVLTDANLNVYIADSSGGRIRVVCVTCGTNSPLDALLAKLGISSPTNGDIYTIAGSGSTATYSGTLPTLATNVSMTPEKLVFDTGGNIYISDANNAIWFVDFHTGYLRAIARNATVCANAIDSVGDGCPATQASFGSAGGNGIGVDSDTLGNLYISDSTNLLIRKVSTGLVSPSTATGSTATQTVQLHFSAGDGPASSNSLAFTSTEWSLGTPSCVTNADSTTDCLLSSSFTPAVPGARSTPLIVDSSLGNTANLALSGIGLGAGSTLDPASQMSFGTNLQVAGLATDTAGNVYVSDAISKQLLRFAPAALVQGTSATSTPLAKFTAPGSVAVDPRGYVYVADTSTGLITQISPSGTTSTLALTLTTPAGLAVDSLNNLYVSDSSAHAVYQLNPITGASRTLAVGTLVAPAGLTIDPSGNLLITDPGAAAIYRFNLESGVTTPVSSAAVAPSAIATDAAGNLLIADTASVLAVPSSSNSAPFKVASLAPSALAIDSAGDLYIGSSGSVLELIRTQGYAQFAGASASPQTVNLLESGNQALQLSSVSQNDTADYNLAAIASTDCTLNGTLPSTLPVGGGCALTATYTPTTFVTTTDTVTFNGNLANAALSTPSSVQLVLTGPAVAPAATIALNPVSPASPVFGQTVTVSATVSGSSLMPAGTVVFTVDSSTTTAAVTGGVATATLTGLSVGTHTLSATYTSSNGFSSATASTTTFTVGQAAATVTLSNLAETYTGSPLSVTAATTPAGLAVSITYNGSTTAPTAAGSYSVIATINNPDYSGSASGTLTIAKATTTVAFSASPSSPTRGQSDLLSAAVTGVGQPGGTVVFSSGATTLCTASLNASAMASCSFVPSTDGNLTVMAQYLGDGNHLASSASLTLFVYDAAVKLQLSSTQLVYPGATNVTVCISPATSATATGTVQIFDGTTLLATLSVQGGGCAYWYISPGLSAGNHQLTAVYSGDRNNPSGTSVPVTVTVTPVPVALSASCWNSSFAYGANYQCTINVSSNAGAPLGSITYTYDGSSPVTVPLSNGNAQFTLTKPIVGTHTVVVAYAQQTNYAAATPQSETFMVTSAPVNVSLTPSSWFAKAGTTLTFQAAVSSWSAGAPNANGEVSFFDGATVLSLIPVNASGQASITTASLPAGTHTITATYAEGTNYASGTASVTITLTP